MDGQADSYTQYMKTARDNISKKDIDEYIKWHVSAHAGLLIAEFNMGWGLLISLLATFSTQGKSTSLV